MSSPTPAPAPLFSPTPAPPDEMHARVDKLLYGGIGIVVFMALIALITSYEIVRRAAVRRR